MNRSALCIQMLQLLKSRGFLTREQIADELQTKVRNISEFRKELEMAGYIIESTTGKFGGYRLLNDCLLPSVYLKNEEIRALKELHVYMNSHQDFFMRKEVARVIDKVLSNHKIEEIEQGMYLDNEQYIVSEKIKEMIQQMEEARNQHVCVELNYKTMKDKTAKAVLIHPYEILNYKGAYYCFAYSMKAKDFRSYKFSEERMKAVHVLETPFTRDVHFDIKHHIGKSGLIKDELVEVELLIYGEVAILVKEKRIGIHPYMEWVSDHTLRLHTIFEGRMAAKEFVLSLGRHACVVSPTFLKEEVLEEAKALLEMYI